MSQPTTRIFNPPNHEPGAPYSHIAIIPLSETAKLVTLAGQIGRDPETRMIPPTLAGQVELALKNVDICLAAAGATRTDIVQVRQYVVNLLPVDKARTQLYTNWMNGHKPPSTVVGVESLAVEGLLYEIEVMAVVRSA